MRNLFRSTGFILAATVAGLAMSESAQAQHTASPEGAQVYFISPQDGDVVSNPVTVVFGLIGMGVAPAGTEKENTGHHHLFIDTPPLGEGEDGAAELTEAIPSDDHHKHFGGGQTQATLELAPGQHTLQLVLGDRNHIPHNPPVTSEVITITVK